MSRTVFISYARKDSEAVEQAVDWLEVGGVEVFGDIDDIEYGDRWEDVITTKLQECERTLVFWSKHASDSEWVAKEYSIALKLDKRLVPVLLDDTPLPADLRQFHALTRFQKNKFRWPVFATFGVAGTVVALIAGFFLFLGGQSYQSETLAQAPSTQVENTTVAVNERPQAVPMARPDGRVPKSSQSKDSASQSLAGSAVDSTESVREKEQVVEINLQTSSEGEESEKGELADSPSATDNSGVEKQDNRLLIWLGVLGILLIAIGLWIKSRQAQRARQAEQFVESVFEDE